MSRLFSQGETAVAPTGLALVLILVGAMVASGWWSVHSRSQTLQQARVDEVRAATVVLADAAEVMLRNGEVSAVRRLVMNAAQEHGLDVCRLSVPGAGVLADADPGKITLPVLPKDWDALAVAPTFSSDEQRVWATRPVDVPGRGTVMLDVEAGPRLRGDDWTLQAGVGAVGVGSLIVLMILYRHLRQQLRPLYAIGESLAAFDGGETTSAALAVSPSFGSRAEAWNQILTERDREQGEQLERQARAAVQQRQGATGDLGDACNALSQGLMVIDDQFHVAYTNGAAAVFVGGKRDEVIHKPMDTLGLDPQVFAAVRQAIVGPSRQRKTLEVCHRGKHSEAVLRFAVRPINRAEAPAAVVVIDDITQQRVAEQSRNTFIAQATHELRTPLTNIRLYVDTALENGDDDAKMRGECLNVINTESRRLESLVADMLSISEIEAGSMTMSFDDVRLDAMFDELEKDYQAQARDKGVTLSFNLPPKLPVIQGDRDRLMVAVQNLIGNALKYTSGGGNVEVAVDATPQRLTIDVKDTGIGIADEHVDKVFDKFYRAGDQRLRDIKGSGLGLPLAREIARLHGGDITVQSKLDHGSTFTMSLPIDVEAV